MTTKGNCGEYLIGILNLIKQENKSGFLELYFTKPEFRHTTLYIKDRKIMDFKSLFPQLIDSQDIEKKVLEEKIINLLAECVVGGGYFIYKKSDSIKGSLDIPLNDKFMLELCRKFIILKDKQPLKTGIS